MKTCIKCKETKDLDKFHKNPKTQDGRLTICKSCTSSYYKERYKDNKGYYKEYKIKNKKTKTISYMIQHGASYQTIKAEIKKCVPLCANCHGML